MATIPTPWAPAPSNPIYFLPALIRRASALLGSLDTLL